MMDCKHCRAGVKPATSDHELSTRECFDLIDDMASFSSPVVMITGGEPMFRNDLPEIIHYMTRNGIGTTLSPCGPLVNEQSLAPLKDAGLGYISFSIDALNATSHDDFRRYPGAFESALTGIQAVKKADMDFAILTTITKHNYHDLPRIIQLASDLGASYFIPFFLVPTGKGRDLRNHQLSPAEYENCLNWLYDLSAGKHIPSPRSDMIIRPGCAPHFHRINLQRDGTYKLSFFGTPITEGCLAGISFLFISYKGTVHPCGYLGLECGDIRKASLQTIWETSAFFHTIRNPRAYAGRCGHCEFLSVCRGCRARAFAETGNYMQEDRYCIYVPQKEEGNTIHRHNTDSQIKADNRCSS